MRCCAHRSNAERAFMGEALALIKRQEGRNEISSKASAVWGEIERLRK
jgi:hypothetical protein